MLIHPRDKESSSRRCFLFPINCFVVIPIPPSLSMGLCCKFARPPCIAGLRSLLHLAWWQRARCRPLIPYFTHLGHYDLEVFSALLKSKRNSTPAEKLGQHPRGPCPHGDLVEELLVCGYLVLTFPSILFLREQDSPKYGMFVVLLQKASYKSLMNSRDSLSRDLPSKHAK